MATRTITAKSYSSSPLVDGSWQLFTVTNDTGPISTLGDVLMATMQISAVRAYRSDCMLLVQLDSAGTTTVAKAGPLAHNETIHAETLSLTDLSLKLLTASPTYLIMELDTAGVSDGDSHFARFSADCTIQIDITSLGTCTPPGTPWLSATQSTGDAVVLQWSAGAGGVDNVFSYYAVERQLSTNGGYSWGEWEAVTNTVDTYAVVQPPATVGYMYRYKVRTVGTAGAAYGSSWYVSSDTLRRIEITRCGTPGSFTLSASESSGSVRMSWTAGASGTENYVSYYEVQRSLSADGGSTWGAWESVGTTSNLYMWVEPPETVGHIYKFYIRTVGSAGTDYASYWLECGKTLKKVKAALVTYTDPEILPGITKVKAAHITELQTNINLVRAAANYIAYEFTAIQAGYTDLNGWNAHIAELRTAIDGLGASHETWLTLGDNCPRADVLMQLRRVVEAVAND